jgi:ankyrin repeat protein
VLENPKVMELLIKHGADLKDIDKKKMTPLMLAAQAGRYKNLKYILEKVRDHQYLNFKGEDGLAAIHYATIGKHQECISLLVDDSLIDK